MPLLILIAYAVFWLLQVGAYFAGTDAYFGIGYFLSFLLLFALAVLPFTGLTIGLVSFYGAYVGWGWTWWQAFFLVAPGISIWIASTAMGGLSILFANARSSLPARKS